MSFIGKMIIVGTLALLFLLIFTDPRQVPSIMLIVPFILLFMILALVVIALLRRFGLARSRGLRIGGLVAALPILLLILQSLGQLTIRDALAMFATFGIAYFYIARLTIRTIG